MRIANLVTSGVSSYDTLRVPASVIPPGVDVVNTEITFNTKPTSPAAEMLLAVGMVAGALRAEREGFDAVLIGSAADYGLLEAQSIVRIPVVGSGTAAALFTSSMCDRFSVVQVWPEAVGWATEKVLRNAGVIDRCGSIRHVSTVEEAETVRAAMYDNAVDARAAMIERISAEIARAVHEDGAEAIILGCTCMTSTATELSGRSEVPIVSPLIVGFQAAMQFAQLGLTPSTVSRYHQNAELAEIFEHLGKALGTSGFSTGNEFESSCPVCAPVYVDDAPKVEESVGTVSA